MMLRRVLIVTALILSLAGYAAETPRLLVTTLNCYFFFGGGETTKDFQQPKTAQDYWKKTSNLVSLLPTNAPFFIALQEIGKARDVVNFSQAATARYKCGYKPIFAQGKDTYTEEDVGALLRADAGWGFTRKPGRDADLDSALSKHLVVSITNSWTALEFCVVHLRRPLGTDGAERQKAQCEALAGWAKKVLQQDTNSNVIILGDFNEAKPVGDTKQTLAVLFETKPPLYDAFGFTKGTVRTHGYGQAYDRVILSESLVRGGNGLKFEAVSVREHNYGKGTNKLWWTDHFPVTASLQFVQKTNR
jgi:endonuclease/exonuclease/phosphatase family metal-dependent hydrolase